MSLFDFLKLTLTEMENPLGKDCDSFGLTENVLNEIDVCINKNLTKEAIYDLESYRRITGSTWQQAKNGLSNIYGGDFNTSVNAIRNSWTRIHETAVRLRRQHKEKQRAAFMSALYNPPTCAASAPQCAPQLQPAPQTAPLPSREEILSKDLGQEMDKMSKCLNPKQQMSIASTMGAIIGSYAEECREEVCNMEQQNIKLNDKLLKVRS